MARFQALVLALALGSVVADDNNGRIKIPSPADGTDARLGCELITPVGDKSECCKFYDARQFTKASEPAQKACVPAKSSTFKKADGSDGNWCEPKCFVDGTGCGNTATGQDFETTAYDDSDNIYECYTTTPKPTTSVKKEEPTTTETTTFTPWDSSASSSDSTNLDSSYSSSFKTYEDSSAQSSWDNSGSDASGSGGSFMKLWQWGIVAALLTCCLCAICAAMMKPKPKPKKKPAPPPPEPEEPMPELAPLMPVTTSYVQQPMVQQPMAYVQQPMAYAAPTTYAAAPAAYVV